MSIDYGWVTYMCPIHGILYTGAFNPDDVMIVNCNICGRGVRTEFAKQDRIEQRIIRGTATEVSEPEEI